MTVAKTRSEKNRPRVCVLVTRFPQVRDTFIYRELRVARERGVADVAIYPLFRPLESEAGLQPDAAVFADAVQRRAGFARSAFALIRWSLRRPRQVGQVIWQVGRESRSNRREALVVLLQAAYCAELATRLGCTQFHAHFDAPSLAADVASALSGLPFSLTVHTEASFGRPAARRLMRNAAAIAVVSEHNRQELDEKFGRASHVHVIRASVPMERFPFANREPSQPLTIVVVAGLETYKGHRYLLEALARPRRASDRAVIIGDGPLRGELEERAVKYGVRDRVTFCGPRPEEDVRRALENADVFVLPSIIAPGGQVDGIPVALMEAMAMGVPVVASNVAAIRELVRDGETGILVRPGDANQIEAALEAITNDPSAAAVRAKAARALVQAEFGADASGAALGRLLEVVGKV